MRLAEVDSWARTKTGIRCIGQVARQGSEGDETEKMRPARLNRNVRD